MAKSPSPLVGFNNNVKHKGRIFHVQTEDSGVGRPHILTHLFADGGRVIKSARTDYSEHVGSPNFQSVVRRLMKEQHKAMFIALRDGQLDEKIERMCGPLSDSGSGTFGAASAPPSSASPSQPFASDVPPSVPDNPPPPPASKVPSTLTDLVLSDLGGARPRQNWGDIAKPPSTVEGVNAAVPTKPSPTPGRYAVPRPAAIFTTTPEQGSIFGGVSISEQSLDEVILSYLAEDLDAEK